MQLEKTIQQLMPGTIDADTAIRVQYLSDIQDIIAMFSTLKQKYILKRNDEKLIAKTITDLSELHYNIITKHYSIKTVKSCRGYIKAVYDLYPIISSRYTKKKKSNFEVIWKVSLALILAGFAFVLTGCDSKEDDNAELYTLNQLIKFECKSNGTGFTVAEDQNVGRVMVKTDVWYYPYTCNNGTRYSKILIKPVKVDL